MDQKDVLAGEVNYIMQETETRAQRKQAKTRAKRAGIFKGNQSRDSKGEIRGKTKKTKDKERN